MSNILDYSSIISSNSTHSDHFNLKENENTTSIRYVNLENINLNLLTNLNKEYIDIGYDSIINSLKQTDYNILFKNSIDLVQRYRRQLTTIERIQDQNHILDRENELFLKRQQTLKDNIDASNRNVTLGEEKCRQLESKLNDSNKSIKALNEEIKKLQNNLDQRDKQYKNDRKKLEKEIEKLKDRIQVLTNTKTKALANIDLSESIYKSNGPRATWNLDTNNSKKQLELYSELVKDYDKKLKELMIENNDVKTFLAKIFTDVDNFINIHQKDSSNLDYEENKYQELYQHSFEEIYKSLNKDFELKLKRIDYMFKNQTLNLNSTQKVDTTLSTINSLNDTMNKSRLIQTTDGVFENKSVNNLNRTLKSSTYIPSSSLSSLSLSSATSNESKKDIEEDRLNHEQFQKDLIEKKQKIQKEQEKNFKSMFYASFNVNNQNN